MSSNPYKVNAPLDLKAGYQPLHRLKGVLSILLYALITLTVLELFVRAAYLLPYLLDAVPLSSIGNNAQLLSYARVLAGISVIRGAVDFLLTLALVIVFILWFHSAYKNLGFLRIGHRMTAGFATASFFIPFANLVLPCRAMQDLWQGSASVPLTESDLANGASSPEPSVDASNRKAGARIIIWWTFVVLAILATVSGFINSIARVFAVDAEGGMLFLTLFGGAAAILRLIAYSLTLWVVPPISAGQEKKARLVTTIPAS